MCDACLHDPLNGAGPGADRRHFLTGAGAALAGLTVAPLAGAAVSGPAQAAGQSRTLFLRNLYTEQVRRFRFIRSGRPDWSTIYELHQFMGDVRNHDMIEIDPALLDLLWRIQQRLGVRRPLGLVSVFRSWQTNSSLRARGRGVAQFSYHLQGKAADIAVEGVPATRLAAVAKSFRAGGVGTYSRSAFPFVHVDTGPPRTWGA